MANGRTRARRETHGPPFCVSLSLLAEAKATHRCPLCPFATDSVPELGRHVCAHAEAAPPSYPNCSVCDKLAKEGGPRCEGFPDAAQLQNHARQQQGEPPFDCAACGLAFAQKAALEAHARTHEPRYGAYGDAFAQNLKFLLKTDPPSNAAFGQQGPQQRAGLPPKGERPFGCGTCGKTFGRKEHIERHMRTHTDERAFVCSVCGKSFRQKVHLARHVRIHTGERPFACSACGKSFRQKEHIHRHMRTHTGERPFACSACGKSFRQKSHVERHLRTHARGAPRSPPAGAQRCPGCGETCATSLELQLHLRSAHGTPFAPPAQAAVCCT